MAGAVVGLVVCSVCCAVIAALFTEELQKERASSDDRREQEMREYRADNRDVY